MLEAESRVIDVDSAVLIGLLEVEGLWSCSVADGGRSPEETENIDENREDDDGDHHLSKVLFEQLGQPQFPVLGHFWLVSNKVKYTKVSC